MIKETNIILIGISLSNLLTIVPTFVYNILFNFGNEPTSLRRVERDAESWPIFLKAHLFISVAFHSISIWLTVYLAGFRYHFMKTLPLKHLSNKPNGNLSRSNYVIVALICFVNLILNVPIFCCSSINNDHLNETSPKITLDLDQDEMNTKLNRLIFKTMLFINAIVGKLLPCVLLTVFISLLIRIISKKKSNSNKIHQRHRLEIKSLNSIFVNPNVEQIQTDDKQNKKQSKIKTEIRNKYEISLLPNWSFNSILMNKRRNSTNSNRVFQQDNLEIKSFNSMLNIGQSECNQKEKELRLKIRNKENSLFPNLPASSFSFNYKVNTINLIKDLSKIEPVLYNSIEILSNNKGLKGSTSIKSSKPRKKHTTLVLTFACLLFLLSELPQFILLLLSLIKEEWFYENAYMLPLTGLIELFMVVSSSTNCLIYSQMSSSYRETLLMLFGLKKKSYL